MNERERLERIIDGYARRTNQHLRAIGCVRLANNQPPQTITVEELAEVIDFPDTLWDTIKDRMLDLGFPIVFSPGRGHYLGFPGEVVMNVVYNQYQIQGRLKRMRKWLAIFGESHSYEEGDKWARENGHGSLADIGNCLKANKLPLPEELHVYLLEANNG